MLGENAFGVQIRDSLSRQIDREIPAAQIYVVLRRLEDNGFIIGTEQDGPAGRRGRPRRVYKLTALGQRALIAGSKLYEHPMPHTKRYRNVGEEETEVPSAAMG